MPSPLIIKLSGRNLGESAELEKLMSALKDVPAVLVHGGGVEVDKLLAALNLTTPKLNGLRVSTPEAMPYITAMLAGTCNRNLQGLAQKAGVQALGLMCTDGGTLKLSAADPMYGRVGTAAPNEACFIENLMEQNILPIMCSIGLLNGDTYNINADDAARALAELLKAPLIFVSDVPGVLDEHKQVIPLVDDEIAADLIARHVVTAGMVVKVNQALAASKQTGSAVILTSLSNLTSSDLHDPLRIKGTVFSARR